MEHATRPVTREPARSTFFRRPDIAFGPACDAVRVPSMRVIVLLLVALAANAALAAVQIPVFRLAQVDTVGAAAAPSGADGDDDEAPSSLATTTTPLGCRVATLEMMAVAAHAEDDARTSRDELLVRKTAVVRLSDLTEERLAAVVRGRKAGGLLVVLPDLDEVRVSFDPRRCCVTVSRPPALRRWRCGLRAVCAASACVSAVRRGVLQVSWSAWATLERALMKDAWDVPVYFTPASAEVESLLSSLYSVRGSVATRGDPIALLMLGLPPPEVMNSDRRWWWL